MLGASLLSMLSNGMPSRPFNFQSRRHQMRLQLQPPQSRGQIAVIDGDRGGVARVGESGAGGREAVRAVDDDGFDWLVALQVDIDRRFGGAADGGAVPSRG